MASNGYVRRECTGCIFYGHDRDFGPTCDVKTSECFEWDQMHWVPATLYHSDPKIAKLHDEHCEHFVSLKEVKREYRRKFGFHWNGGVRYE